jgi:hypothetical protein
MLGYCGSWLFHLTYIRKYGTFELSRFDVQFGKYLLSDRVGPIALSLLDLELIAVRGGVDCYLVVKYFGSRNSRCIADDCCFGRVTTVGTDACILLPVHAITDSLNSVNIYILPILLPTECCWSLMMLGLLVEDKTDQTTVLPGRLIANGLPNCRGLRMSWVNRMFQH